jgi:hypothetical protein
LGDLDVAFRVGTDEKRYLQESDDAATPPPKGKVLVESVTVSIQRGEETLLQRVFRGNRGRRSEVFAPGSPVEDGYRVRVNRAEIDFLEVATALLQALSPAAFDMAERSDNKYLSAATQLFESGRGQALSRRESSESQGEDDD